MGLLIPKGKDQAEEGLSIAEDVPLVEFMYLVLFYSACQVRVTTGDSGLCCCV